MIIILTILISLFIFFLGMGIGRTHANKKIEKHITVLEYYSDISDGQFRDIVVNTYTDKYTKDA